MTIITNPPKTPFRDDIEGIFDTLQKQRSALLGMAGEVQRAARLLALDEARRLAQLGKPADPRVARLADSALAMQRRAAVLDVEAQIAAIRVPAITKAETLLQGRITDEDDRAVGQLQMTLIDDAGAPVAGVAPVATDASGYYAFILQPAQVAALAGKRKLMLRVGSGDAALVPAGAKPLTLAAGQVTVSETALLGRELDKLRRAAPAQAPQPKPARPAKPKARAAKPAANGAG